MSTAARSAPRILVADDDAVSLHFLIAALQELGCEAVGVDSGAATLAAFDQHAFDLLLLDRRMADFGGAILLRKLREAGHYTPAIATSAALDAAQRVELAAAGFFSAQLKPIAIEQLHATVNEALSLSVSARFAVPCNRHLLLPKERSGIARSPPAAQSIDNHVDALVAAHVLLDDAAALAGVGGDRSILRAMRGLLLQDLAVLLKELPESLADAMKYLAQTLHKLRAACRYCGAIALGDRAARLERAVDFDSGLHASEVWAFKQCCELTASALRALDGTDRNSRT